MKAKKLLSMLSVLALLLSLLSACGQGQGSTPSQAPSSPSTAPAIAPADGPSITTNGGEVIALSALEHQSADGSAVYYLSDITPEAMVAVYEALEWSPTGKVAVKLSTGEPPNSNYLRPELIKDVVQGGGRHHRGEQHRLRRLPGGDRHALSGGERPWLQRYRRRGDFG